MIHYETLGCIVSNLRHRDNMRFGAVCQTRSYGVPTCQVLQRCETGPESQLPEQVIWGYEALSNALEETSVWLSLLSSVVFTFSMWLLCCYSLMVCPCLAWVKLLVVACFFLTSVTCEKDWTGTKLWILVIVFSWWQLDTFGSLVLSCWPPHIWCHARRGRCDLLDSRISAPGFS